MIREKVGLKGHTKIWIEKTSGVIVPVCNRCNTIEGNIREFFADAMHSSGSLPNIALDDLFTSDNEEVGGSEDGNDGIVVATDNKQFTTITTTMSAENTYGKKWRGDIQFDASHSIVKATLGHDYGGDSIVSYFDSTYATQSISEGDVQTSDRMIIEWEIYL